MLAIVIRIMILVSVLLLDIEVKFGNERDTLIARHGEERTKFRINCKLQTHEEKECVTGPETSVCHDS